MRLDLQAYLSSVLGEVRVFAEHTHDHGQACVLEVADAHGRLWVGKQHRRLPPWEREQRAYTRWTSALGGAAPALRASDETRRVLVTSAVPGRPADDSDQTHRQAGRLLATLHRAEPPQPYPDFADACQERMEALLRRAAGLLDARESGFVRSQVRVMSTLPSPAAVPCHLDYSARNWLVDDDGGLHVIDFAGAGRDVWVRDLRRLEFGSWASQPGLREAFFDGYGRMPTVDDAALLRASGALTALSRIVRGTERGLPKATADGRLILARLMYGRIFAPRTTARLAKKWRATTCAALKR